MNENQNNGDTWIYDNSVNLPREEQDNVIDDNSTKSDIEYCWVHWIESV